MTFRGAKLDGNLISSLPYIQGTVYENAQELYRGTQNGGGWDQKG